MLDHVCLARVGVLAMVAMVLSAGVALAENAPPVPAREQVMVALCDPVNSTGNIANAVEEATEARGWMSAYLKPIFESRIAGRAATAPMRPVFRSDAPRVSLRFAPVPEPPARGLDQSDPGSILVCAMQDGLEIATMGNLMTATAKVRGLEGAVIDGAVRDITATGSMLAALDRYQRH